MIFNSEVNHVVFKKSLSVQLSVKAINLQINYLLWVVKIYKVYIVLDIVLVLKICLYNFFCWCVNHFPPPILRDPIIPLLIFVSCFQLFLIPFCKLHRLYWLHYHWSYFSMYFNFSISTNFTNSKSKIWSVFGLYSSVYLTTSANPSIHNFFEYCVKVLTYFVWRSPHLTVTYWRIAL